MALFHQGIFKPKNPKKYTGAKLPTYRSSWELQFFIWMDEHQSVVNWASEAIKIPYINPLTNKAANYIPDILIHYVDKNGFKHIELVEIKPLKESLLEKAKSKKDKMAYLQNQAKWKAASAYCKHHGITFRVLTEKDLFFRK